MNLKSCSKQHSEAPPLPGMASMVSKLQAAVQQWRELGLLQNRHTGESGNADQDTISEHQQRKKRRKKRDKDWNYRTTTGRNLQQTTLFGKNLEKADLEVFGDSLKAKESNNFRVISQNIQKLPESACTERSRRVTSTISSTEADVLLMNEVSLYWPKVGITDKWFERVIGKFRAHRALFGYNTNEHNDTDLFNMEESESLQLMKPLTEHGRAVKTPPG